MKGKGATRVQPKSPKLDWVALGAWFKRLGVATTVIAVLTTVTLLGLQWVNKDVERLKINAPLLHVTELHIREVLQPHFPSSFFYLDVQEVRDSLLALPMVREAKVKKVWPDTLIVELQEEVPVARWNHDAMLSHAGLVLPMDVQMLNKELVLPSLQGPSSERQNVMRHFHLFTQWAKAYSLQWVGVEQSSAGWRLLEKNGLSIWLDRQDAMAGLKRLGGVLQKLNLQNVTSIDLRYEQGFAVAWRPLTETAEKKEKRT